ncbi:glyoxylate reductase/hydroxypyruvate reductase-like isoform X2 [Macrosteles quadrilineatus]|uniref:glyoxylate reductase/hydroxypyruvate reductase-like isoform X2 n=1 Tax=Macrosteles quadrilineatus TaxID=74068 RepID=UPI0023E1EFC3|nr:glyoxylate reductase/hydroxypyruvate reductase-like isoform X2 [Macrosteles quadrilineatus]
MNFDKYRILITHPDIPAKALNMLQEKGYELKISQMPKESSAPPREILLKDVQNMDAILWFGHVKVDKEMIDAAGERLKVVGSMGAGYDHIDVGLLHQRSIRVSNTPDVLSSAVADMAVGLALAVSRNIVTGAAAVKQGKWIGVHPTWMCGPTLENATVGIVGLGAIGSKILQRVKAFDVKEVLYYNRREKNKDEANGACYTSLDELLKKSDFIFLTVPSNKDSKGLIDKNAFKKMKNTAILINSARGDVINQDDLVMALENKEIGGAGLDVTQPEPLPVDHKLLKFDNVVVTPHISSATFQAREKMAVLAAENIICALENKVMPTPIQRQ